MTYVQMTSVLAQCQCTADVMPGLAGKGAKQYSVYMPASITALQTLTTSTSRVSKCVVVALSNGEVMLSTWVECVQILSHDAAQAELFLLTSC